MGYTPDTQKITSPVSMNDIQQALGYFSHNDIGGLIADGPINKWSKFKPFRKNVIAFASESARLAALKEADCGFSIPKYSSPFALLNAYRTQEEGYEAWEYLKPQGGSLQPYRMGDFIGYYGGPQNPFIDLTITPKEIYAIDSFYYTPGGMVDATGDHVIQLSDLQSLVNITPSGKSEPYIGCVICEKGVTATNANSYVRTLDNDPENTMIENTEFKFTLPQNKEWVACFFYSKVPIHNDNVFNTTSAEHTNAFIPIPMPVAKFTTSASFGLEFEGTIANGTIQAFPVVNGQKTVYTRERKIGKLVISYRTFRTGQWDTDGANYIIPEANTSVGDWDWVVLAANAVSPLYVSAKGFRIEGTSVATPKTQTVPSQVTSNPNGEWFADFQFIDDKGVRHSFVRKCATIQDAGGK